MIHLKPSLVKSLLVCFLELKLTLLSKMANLSIAQTILTFFTDALNFDFSEIMVLYVMDTYSVFQAQKQNFGLGNYAGQILDPAGNCRV